MSKRRLNDWMTGYLDYVDNTEPPLSYHIWTGLSTLAGAMQRKVFMDWNMKLIYPNLYVVLVGPSGRCKKGTAMNFGKELLTEIQSVSITASSITREALVGAMIEAQRTFMNPEDKSGVMNFHNSVTVYSDELSVFLGNNDLAFLANLTDWYDCPANWAYETKSRGKENVGGVCLNLIGGTAPDWFTAILPEEAIGGGFTSRIFFIVEERKRKTVAEHITTEQEKRLKKALIEDLERVNKIVGEYRFSENAKEAYIDWYEQQDADINKGTFPVTDPRFAGYCDRRATHIKKLCMIFAASRSDSLIIDIDDFDRSLEVMVKAEIMMPKAFSGLGTSDYARIIEKIITFFKGKKGTDVPLSTLMTTFYRDMDLQTWDIIKKQLEAMKYLQIIVDFQTQEHYRWVGPK